MKLRLIYAVLLVPCVIGTVLTSSASAAPHQTAGTPRAAAATCVRNIHVTRFVGQTEASWTLKCAHSAQVFADWFGVEVFGPKSTGAASFVNEPTNLGLAKADCAGYATYSASGQQTSRVITYGRGC